MENEYLHQRLNLAQKLILQDRRFDDAIVILKEILKYIPTNYQHYKIKDDTEYIEFWDQEEFFEYIEYIKKTNSKMNVNWIGNIYPKACYLVSVALIETEKLDAAEEYLNKGLLLEKDQPMILNELGMLNIKKATYYNDTNYFKEAIKYHKRALNSRPYITKALKARALRGIGFCEIELRNFDEAEKYFKDSLEYEDNGIAFKELLYIQMAKKGINAPIETNLSRPPSSKEIKSISEPSEKKKSKKVNSFFNKFFKN